MSEVLIIGGAGFIGSHLVDRLAADGVNVTVYDNFSTGRTEWLKPGAQNVVQGDVLDLMKLTRTAEGCDALIHLSANPEARWGLENSRLDLEQGTIATWNALEAARQSGVKSFVFASSGTVYGDRNERSAEGDLGSLPISLYGASKLAGEAMISAYAEAFGLRTAILRFGNAVGPRATHGVIFDLLSQLKKDRTRLHVLGDGQQRKPYVHVSQIVGALANVLGRSGIVLNVAPLTTTSVAHIVLLCLRYASEDAVVTYAGGRQGWKGDVAVSELDGRNYERIFGVQLPSSNEAVEHAVQEIADELGVETVG